MLKSLVLQSTRTSTYCVREQVSVDDRNKRAQTKRKYSPQGGGLIVMKSMEIGRVEFCALKLLPEHSLPLRGFVVRSSLAKTLSLCRDETEFAILEQMGEGNRVVLPATVASHLEPKGVRSERPREKGAGLWPSTPGSVRLPLLCCFLCDLHSPFILSLVVWACL